MSGHPHPGKRSEWYFVEEFLPTMPGPYEFELIFDPGIIMATWEGSENTWTFSIGGMTVRMPYTHICGRWRGLAERPE